MRKFAIIFYKPPDVAQFERHYAELLRLTEAMPGVIRRQIVKVTGSPRGVSLHYRFLELYFVDQSQMEAALLSPAGQKAGSKMADFSAGSFEVIFAEVGEETLSPSPCHGEEVGG